jgi:hypothetical protein
MKTHKSKREILHPLETQASLRERFNKETILLLGNTALGEDHECLATIDIILERAVQLNPGLGVQNG